MQKLTETLSALRSRFYSGALKAERSCTGRLAELDAAKVRYGAWQDARHARDRVAYDMIRLPERVNRLTVEPCGLAFGINHSSRPSKLS